jgi:hypothetical protein
MTGAPTSQVDRLAGSLADMRRRIADLERLLQGRASAEGGSYTPALTGMVVGSGGVNTATWGATRTGQYWKMHLSGTITFGTSGNTYPPADSRIAMPAGWQMVQTSGRRKLGDVIFVDVSTGSHIEGVLRGSGDADEFRVYVKATAASRVGFVVPGASEPFGWDVSDDIRWSATVFAVRS